jgi:excisionase family DNA binding protein
MALNLLTAAEVADLLRMNHQVVLRKLATGEIAGYKLGKEWRVREEALVDWLEKHSNRQDERSRVLRAFFDHQGKLVSIPAKHASRLIVLRRLVEEFEPARVYSEREVNTLLRRFHSDVCALRREFIMNKLMVRKDGNYTVCTSA